MGSGTGRRRQLHRARAGGFHRHDGARDRRVKPFVLLFDLDGTLTDPRPGIVRCMKHALDTLRAPCPSDDVLASFIGPPLRETFATLLETSNRSLVERALALYREEYADTGLFENRIYAGVGHVRRDLETEALRRSNRAAARTRAVLRRGVRTGAGGPVRRQGRSARSP